MITKRWGAAVLVFVVAGLGWLAAQAPSATKESFEVASVKPNKSVNAFSMLGAVSPGGRFTMTNVSVRDMIGLAYRLRDFQIVGGPAWIASDRFDVLAKAATELRPPPAPWDADPSRVPALLMVQSLLADRFHLVVHPERRDGAIYGLTLARSDRRPGPELKPSTVDCDAVRAARRARAVPAGPPPPPPPPPQPGETPAPCTSGGGAGGYIFGGTMPMAVLTQTLSRIVGRPVIDQTGLNGNFDFALVYAPDQAPPVPLPPGVGPAPAIANAPPLFTALQEQLGLKLESQRAPIDYLMVDAVDHPTEN